jgi:hypothetical protein
MRLELTDECCVAGQRGYPHTRRIVQDDDVLTADARRPRRIGARLGARASTGVVVVAVLVAGCTSTRSSPPQPSPNAGPSLRLQQLDASVTQDRPREGTRELLAGVTNNTGHDIRVSSATIRWSGLDFPIIKISEPVVPAGQTAAFTIDYGKPHCESARDAPPTMSTVVDGRRADLPLHVDMPGLLGQLRAKACAAERLSSVATVRLRLARHATVVHGVAYLPGVVTVRHRPGADGPVTVVDLSGSVLFVLTPRNGRRALPARLVADQRVLSLPVLVGSNDRCDAHSRSQSSQTFLLSVYVRRKGAAAQRVITIPSHAEQLRLLALLDRVCG